jgi:hypothetical protein
VACAQLSPLDANEGGIVFEHGATMSRILRSFSLLFCLSIAVGCGGTAEDGSSGGSAGNGGSSGNAGAPAGGSSGAGGASGSSGAGGASGSSGAGGIAGAAGGAGVAPECSDASECTLFSDCCTCLALAPNEPSPKPCPATCIQDACSALAVTKESMACTGGRCVAGISCAGQVPCASLPPTCEPGFVPSTPGGCWGPCVPATECASVFDCNSCNGPEQTCVVIDHQGGEGDPSSRHCVDIPQACSNNPTCACMAENVCIDPFSACVDLSGIKGMSCSCLNC